MGESGRASAHRLHCPLLSCPGAIQLGSCAVGIRTDEGVVLGVEKRSTSTLLEQSSIEKIFELDHHIGAAISGLTADARTLVDHCRVEATNHTFVYDERIKVRHGVVVAWWRWGVFFAVRPPSRCCVQTQSLTQSVCDLMLSFGEGGDEAETRVVRRWRAGSGSWLCLTVDTCSQSRPFGVSLLIAGCDGDKPQLCVPGRWCTQLWGVTDLDFCGSAAGTMRTPLARTCCTTHTPSATAMKAHKRSCVRTTARCVCQQREGGMGAVCSPVSLVPDYEP